MTPQFGTEGGSPPPPRIGAPPGDPKGSPDRLGGTGGATPTSPTLVGNQRQPAPSRPDHSDTRQPRTIPLYPQKSPVLFPTRKCPKIAHFFRGRGLYPPPGSTPGLGGGANKSPIRDAGTPRFSGSENFPSYEACFSRSKIGPRARASRRAPRGVGPNKSPIRDAGAPENSLLLQLMVSGGGAQKPGFPGGRA